MAIIDGLKAMLKRKIFAPAWGLSQFSAQPIRRLNCAW